MIELKVDNKKCETKAAGRASDIAIEVMTATHALIEIFATTSNMSFEAAALTIMQANNAIYRKQQGERNANMD